MVMSAETHRYFLRLVPSFSSKGSHDKTFTTSNGKCDCFMHHWEVCSGPAWEGRPREEIIYLFQGTADNKSEADSDTPFTKAEFEYSCAGTNGRYVVRMQHDSIGDDDFIEPTIGKPTHGDISEWVPGYGATLKSCQTAKAVPQALRHDEEALKRASTHIFHAGESEEDDLYRWKWFLLLSKGDSYARSFADLLDVSQASAADTDVDWGSKDSEV